MIVADSSAWIEYLRGTGSPIDQTLARLIGQEAEIGLTEYIVMEILAGARSRLDLTDLESLVMTYPLLHLQGVVDFEAAAELYRECRGAGETIRKLSDCLIAVPVIRAGAELLHNDSDFDAIARHSELRVYRWREN